MPQDAETKVLISYETKGYDKALRQTMGMSEKAMGALQKQAKAYEGVQKEVGGLQEKLGGLTKQQLELSRKMEAIPDKAVPAYKKLTDELRKVQKEARDVERVIKNLEKAYTAEGAAVTKLAQGQKEVLRDQQKAAQQSKGAFAQGVIQAGVPGMAPLFMQRGPGMRRQAAGMLAGGALRRMGRVGWGMTGGMAFQGLGGVQAALSAIPGGSVIAAQLGSAASYAQQALQWKRQQVEMAPYVGGTSSEGIAAQKRLADFRGTRTMQRVLETTRANVAAGLPPEEAPERQPVGLIGSMLGVKGAKKGPGVHERVWQRTLGKMGAPQARYARRDIAAGVKSKLDAVEAELETAASRTAGPTEKFAAMGMRLRGLGKQASLQEIAGLIQAGGAGRQTAGDLARGGQGDFMTAALAARTRFGVGAQEAGAFLQAGRRGGLAGGRGKGGETLTEALREGLQLGLEGSELITYTQQIASGIQSFQQTGIPFTKESINSMALEIANKGIAGTRATRVAGGFQQYGQRIGARGPTSGLDLMMMRTFTGFKGGAGEDLEEALIQMEEMGGRKGGLKAGGAMEGIVNQLIGLGGGGKRGRIFARQRLAGQGIQVGGREMRMWGKQLAGEEITPEERELVKKEQDRMAAGAREAKGLASPQAMAKLASGMISPALKKQAEIQNAQLRAGEKTYGVVLKLEKSATNMAIAVGDLAAPGGVIDRLATAVEAFTGELSKSGLFGAAKAFIAKLGED